MPHRNPVCNRSTTSRFYSTATGNHWFTLWLWTLHISGLIRYKLMTALSQWACALYSRPTFPALPSLLLIMKSYSIVFCSSIFELFLNFSYKYATVNIIYKRLLLLLVFCFFKTIICYSPGWPQTPRDPLALVFQVLGLQVINEPLHSVFWFVLD